MPPNQDGWPTSMTDSVAARQPILSDRSASSSNPNPAAAGEGHPFNGRLKNINLLFADGHIETHQTGQVRMRYQGNYYNFY
jgi:prepilin-type processing-associated H-X9-DG protein